MKLAAQIISIVFHPILMPTFFCILLFNSESYLSLISIQAKFITTVSIFTTTFVLPSSIMPVLKHIGWIRSYEMEDKKERLLPLFVTAASYAACFLMLMRFPFPVPAIFYRTLIGASAALLISLFISIKWKISAHTTGLGGLVASLVGFGLRYGAGIDQWLGVAIIASGLAASARLYLGAHSVMQVAAGFALGFIFVAYPVFFM